MAGQDGRTFSFDNETDDPYTSFRRNPGHLAYQHPDNTTFPNPQPSLPPYLDSPERAPSPPAHRSQPHLSLRTDSSDSAPRRPLNLRRERERLRPIETNQQPRERNRDLGYSTSNRTASTTTPGADNLGESAAGGGIAGIALGVANTNERESGVEAVRIMEGMPAERGHNIVGSDTPYVPAAPPGYRISYQPTPYTPPAASRVNPFDDTYRHSPSPSRHSLQPSVDHSPTREHLVGGYGRNQPSYTDNPYNRYSAWDPRISRADIDPNDIEDEDDAIQPANQRRSIFGGQSSQAPEAGAVAGGAAAGGVLGTLGGLVGRKNPGIRDSSGQYGPVGGNNFDHEKVEKSEWLDSQTSGRKRLRWIVGIALAIILIGAIVGGVIAGVKKSKSDSHNSSNNSPSSSASQDDQNGDLNKDSAEIKELMNNPGLHKVFPGMDYTPFNTQYPQCLSNPPSQNNVTRDMAVLSQLTNAVRLYGTDCNQTEMVLHSISALGLTDMKVWLGVWLDNNQTTNDRGLKAMNDILSKNGANPFAGVIIGNEVLYREDLTEDALSTILANAKKNLTAQNIKLPVATSDLGDAWTPDLASSSDIVMSNIHPFFGGVPVAESASWTWTFWGRKDRPLTAVSGKPNIISEVGWPSDGGNNCVPNNCTSKTEGSIAGISEMNTFMDDFVCQSLANGTDYFW